MRVLAAVWPLLIGALAVSACGSEDDDAPCSNCCRCAWSCNFSNAYGSGVQTGSGTIQASNASTCLDCEQECWDLAADGDCVSNIDVSQSEPCSD